MDYKGVIIEESLEDKDVLKNLNIIFTKTERVTIKHKTPWVNQWTLHTINISEDNINKIAEKVSKSLDSKHSWYADFKNEKFHYIIFRDKVFKINIRSKEEYNKAREYGISLGIPKYLVNFHPEVI